MVNKHHMPVLNIYIYICKVDGKLCFDILKKKHITGAYYISHFVFHILCIIVQTAHADSLKDQSRQSNSLPVVVR